MVAWEDGDADEPFESEGREKSTLKWKKSKNCATNFVFLQFKLKTSVKTHSVNLVKTILLNLNVCQRTLKKSKSVTLFYISEKETLSIVYCCE